MFMRQSCPLHLHSSGTSLRNPLLETDDDFDPQSTIDQYGVAFKIQGHDFTVSSPKNGWNYKSIHQAERWNLLPARKPAYPGLEKLGWTSFAP